MLRLLSFFLGLLVAVDFASAADERVRVEMALSTPRSRDPVLGGSRDKLFVAVWIPEGLATVRGLVCNPFSKDEGVSKHWQAACRHWGFAYVQVDFDGVKKDDFKLLLSGLAELARRTKHPELEHAPFCFLGMSRGGGMSMQLAEMLPERTLASVPVCLEVGPGSEATRQVPVMTIFGEKDGAQMPKLLEKLPVQRKDGARWGIAVQWNRKHEFALANNLAFVFLDDVIRRRLPKSATGKPTLQTIPLEEGWLGDVGSWGKDGRTARVTPWKEFTGARDAACWFPGERTAAVWQAFVSADRSIKIEEPPGLGDGQPFVLHSAARPVTVKLTLPDTVQPRKVELRDAHRSLDTKTAGPWSFEVRLEPGIHSLIAHVETEPGSRFSRPHTIIVE